MSSRWTFTGILSAIWTGLDGVRKLLHLLVLLVVFSIVLGALSSQSKPVPALGALIIQPAGTLVDQLAGDPYDRALQELLGDEETQTLVKDVVDGLAFARSDARISAVVLDLSAMPGGGLSKLERIGNAIDDFKSSGKPVIAMADYYGQGSYYLASRADEVYLHPDGLFLLRGFGIYFNYYKGLLDKLRVDWNVFKVGTHKSAPEPFTRDGMSDENRESMTSLLDQLWTDYQSDVLAARELDDGTIGDVMDNLVLHTRSRQGDLARLALDFGFVDGLMTRHEIRDRINALAGTELDENGNFPATELGDYLAQMRLMRGESTAESNVAVIVAAGEILNGTQPPGTIGGDSTATLLRQARNDDSVKAVVLRVDSPGGSAFASEVIRNEIQALRDAGIPVVASMSSVAASGGYWIAMAADRIFASQYTITGSIGIFGMFPTYQRSLDAIGVTTDGVGSTFWAGEMRADREMSDASRTMFQLVIDKGYDDFISRVALHRGMDKAAVDAVAQGQVWSGNDALERRLIDEIGGIDEALAAAAELAGLEEGGYGTRYLEKRLSPGERLALDLMSRAKSLGLNPSAFSPRASAVRRVATLVDDLVSPLLRFDDPKGVYAHCFCNFQ